MPASEDTTGRSETKIELTCSPKQISFHRNGSSARFAPYN